MFKRAGKRWTIKLYIIWIRIATSYWWAKSVWGHESTHDQHEKPKIIFAYVILSFGYDFDYSHFFFAPALVEKQWKTARVMLGHHATICTCKFILHIGRMVYADEREWAKVPKKGWKNGRHTIFSLASQNMLLSLAIVPDFRFPLISFHHQCQKWLQKTHRTTTDPKFIFRFFFRLVCVCVVPFFACTATFFLFVNPSNSFGWPVKFLRFVCEAIFSAPGVMLCMCIFKVFTSKNDFCFTWSEFCSACVCYCCCLLCVVLSFENPFEHSFISYCNGI